MSRLLVSLVLALIAPVSMAAPVPKMDLPPGEKYVEFDYVFEGARAKGTCRVLTLDIGGETMDFVRIPKGTFTMGSPQEEEGHRDDEGQHQVEFTNDFYLGRSPVTQAQYKAITGDNPSRFKGDRLPVEKVNWSDADAYCKALSKKLKRKVSLPSEAQWEYACRAGTRTAFHFGSKLNGDLANCDGNHPYGARTVGPYKMKTTAAGSYPANVWGLYDMHGNVWQWCQDWYGPYSKLEDTRDPLQAKKQSDNHKVLRGGCWEAVAAYCRTAHRLENNPDDRGYLVGFRVLLSLEK